MVSRGIYYGCFSIEINGSLYYSAQPKVPTFTQLIARWRSASCAFGKSDLASFVFTESNPFSKWELSSGLGNKVSARYIPFFDQNFTKMRLLLER